jgi:N6-adenosine-specific RNA methylase IME4
MRQVSGRQPPAGLPGLQGRFGVIYADPPWRFETYSRRGKGRSAEAHYNCMAFPDVRRLPVGEHAASDCCLFLWTTDPMLLRAMELIDAWGFTFKTVAFTWVKLNSSVRRPIFGEQNFFTGMGYWTRGNPEQCLLATVGRPQRISKAVRQLIISPRREHSRKPDEVYGRIENLVPGPYLELFARSSRPGWTPWGNQVGLFDAVSVPIGRVPSTTACHSGVQLSLLDESRQRLIEHHASNHPVGTI